jgi:hypothetical protein
MMIRLRTAAACTLLGLTLGAAACGDDSSSSSDGTSATTASGSATTASGSATTEAGSATTRAGSATTETGSATTEAGSSDELCDERAALRSSIEDLKNVDVLKDGTSALEEPLADVKDNVAAVRSAASSEVKPEADALNSAIQDLENAVKNPSAGGIAAVATAASKVASAGTALMTSLDSLKCN